LSHGDIDTDKSNDYKKLNDIVNYCNTEKCLREYILNYFGEKIKIEKNNAAKIAVLPGFNAETGSLTEMTVYSEELEDSLVVTLAFMDDQLFGAAVATHTNKAFGGRFDIMVGFDLEGNVLNTVVLEHHETPGLGDKIDKKKSAFSEQFNGKNPTLKTLIVKKDGGEVDAITAATISSRAFCDAVNNAAKAFQTAMKSGELNMQNELTGNNIAEKEENHE
jgi:electron transport complex protein RnfG